MQRYKIEYSEICTYVEVISALNEESAYKEFYKNMEDNKYDEDSCEMNDITITPIVDD